jgi:hypothetical protein
MEEIDFLISLLNNKKKEEVKADTCVLNAVNSNNKGVLTKITRNDNIYNDVAEDEPYSHNDNVILPMLKTTSKSNTRSVGERSDYKSSFYHQRSANKGGFFNPNNMKRNLVPIMKIKKL